MIIHKLKKKKISIVKTSKNATFQVTLFKKWNAKDCVYNPSHQ